MVKTIRYRLRRKVGRPSKEALEFSMPGAKRRGTGEEADTEHGSVAIINQLCFQK